MSPPPNIASNIEPGTVPSIKDVYKGKENCPCCITWSTSPLKQTTLTTATDTSSYAILARQTEGHGDFGQNLKLHSLVIQSELIKDVLDKVLKDYPGITTGLDNLVVESPFAAFYHRWDELVTAYEESEGKKKEHMKLLIDILTTEFEGMHTTVKNQLKKTVIEYKYIWAIFQPGQYIHTRMHGEETIMYLESGLPYDETHHGGQKGWVLSARHVDYNGSMTGFGTTKIKIQEFKGTCAVSELEARPLDLEEDREALVQRARERGRVWKGLRGMSYMEYSGTAVHRDDDSYDGYDTQVNGRVMVDAFAYFQFNRHDVINLRSLSAPPPPIVNLIYAKHHGRSKRGPPPPGMHINMGGPPPPPPPPPMRYDDYGNAIYMKKKRLSENEQAVLSEEDLLCCVPFVRGYSFKNKEWVSLNISSLRPVQWTPDLFTNLVLPTSEKSLLITLARAHSQSTTHFDDFVIGKGKGMIVLLDGPPGVGKTLTAESVAEEMQVPLYTMSAGELGREADRVERKLGDVLEMATMWGAVLLLDEADVFLEERGSGELERNELVAIFLRHLEYFKGLMILTTNRISTMDLAFDSRVDIRIHYPDLSPTARQQIWLNFIKRIPGESQVFSDEEMERLAKLDLNGRQIKSAMKTACLLAVGSGERVGFGHVESVLRITRGFVV